MQRLSLPFSVLRRIVFPRLEELRHTATARSSPPTGSSSRPTSIAAASFCSSCSVNKPSTNPDVDAPPSHTHTPIPMWSTSSSSGYGSPRPRGHDPPLLIPSSSAQRTKVYLGMDNGRPHMHQDVSSVTVSKISSKQAKTAALALRRILEVYQIPSTSITERDHKHEYKRGLPSSSSPTISHPQTSEISTPTNATSTSDLTSLSHPDRQTHIQTPLKIDVEIPPILARLLSARLYRLAVFHTLSTPEYASDRVLVSRLVEELEQGGAGKLARRLKKGWEVVHLPDTIANPRDNGKKVREGGGGIGNGQKDKMRLWSDPRDDANGGRLPPNHWNPICVPPTFTSSTIASSSSSKSQEPQSKMERTSALTAHYNAHLIYLLTRPSSPSTHSRHPAIPISPSGKKPWPIPNPSLAQLKRLLTTIEKLETSRGFRSDWKTAEIVIGCWLRCLSTHQNNGYQRHEPERYGFGDRRVGVNRSRTEARFGFGSAEIMALFEIVRRAMERSRPSRLSSSPAHSQHTDRSVENCKTKVRDAEQSLISEREKEWIEHIRHFGKLVLRALRNSGSGSGSADQRNLRRVARWMKDQTRVNKHGD